MTRWEIPQWLEALLAKIPKQPPIEITEGEWTKSRELILEKKEGQK